MVNYLVGSAAVILNPLNQVLLGRRVDFDGNEVWALFGGKPEAYESLAEGIAREIVEEVNIKADASRYILYNIVEASPGVGLRCLTAYFWIHITASEMIDVLNLEPTKCFEIGWFDLSVAVKMNLWQNSCSVIREVAARLSIDI